jgi:membrane-associated HD superfamily phosphohydrolase
MSQTPSPTCSNDIYSDKNYEKLRESNLKKILDLYNETLNNYSSVYNNYLEILQNAMNEPNNAELQNKKDMLMVRDRPIIKKLNQKLIDIESSILDNNKIIRQDIDEQKKQLDLDQKEKKMIEVKIDKLDKLVKSTGDYADTGSISVKNLTDKYDSASLWYYILITINIILFIVFCVIYYGVL